MKKVIFPLVVALAAVVAMVRNADTDGLEAIFGQTENTARQGQEHSAAHPSAECVKGLEIPVYNPSRGGQTLVRTGYTLSYDADFKTPQWVAWTLDKRKVGGTVKRADKFVPDPDVRGAKAYPADYTNSGYDRGHIAPAGDMKWSAEAMTESFYMTNICPQNRNLNRGDWKDLEELERDWATAHGTLYIAAGPVYESKCPQRIGAHRVAVPDAFFKVLLLGYPGAPKAFAFLFPNKSGSRPLTACQLTVDELEERTGMDFFASLPDSVEGRIEALKPAMP